MDGKIAPDLLRGKDVIFAPASAASPDQHYLPGHNKVHGAYIHLIAGEALKRGNPVDIGWVPALALSFIAVLGALAWRGGRWFALSALGLTLALIAAKVIWSLSLVSIQVGAALFFIAAISANVSRICKRAAVRRCRV